MCMKNMFLKFMVIGGYYIVKISRGIVKHVYITSYCKRENFRVGVIFAFFVLLSFSQKLPPRENKTHMPLWRKYTCMSGIVKIIPTWNISPTFSRNFPPAKITTFTVLFKPLSWKINPLWVELNGASNIPLTSFLCLFNTIVCISLSAINNTTTYSKLLFREYQSILEPLLFNICFLIHGLKNVDRFIAGRCLILSWSLY